MHSPCGVLLIIKLVQMVNSKYKDPATHLYKPTWMYKCMQGGGCLRIKGTEFVDQQAGHYKSLSICRLICNRLGTLWPRPHASAFGTETRRIHPDFIRFYLDQVPSSVKELLVKMIQMTLKNLHAECRQNVTMYSTTSVIIHITVKRENANVVWDIDESYTLDVKTHGSKANIVHMKADTVFGARHALESFVQLVAADSPALDHNVCSLNLLVGTKIRDRPAYTHRGLMLDTARHFIPIGNIKKMIEGMGATKMNVLHWHVTDSQSFPLESSRIPQFTRYGANSPKDIYTTKDVHELVEYALVHGVRVVIEIDSPAHAGNGWQWGKEQQLGDLAVCVNAEPWKKFCLQPPCGQLNPANPNMYMVLKELYRDIADMLLQPALLHVGGDEVRVHCWNDTEEVRTYMEKNGMDLSKEGFFELQAEFHRKALDAWDEVNKIELPVMIWSSDLTTADNVQKYLDSNRYVIEVWEDSLHLQTTTTKLLKLGYRTVFLPNDVWYLDNGLWGKQKYSNWQKMYSHQLPTDQNVLGGEVAMWTEYVDAMALDSRVWPRAAAVAERLWSNPMPSDETEEPRLQMLRERLINRGLRPDVLSPVWCSQNDFKC